MDNPVILASNHPTAFIEPCILACFQPLSLHFIVRGDIFTKPIYVKLLNSLNMIPIFRRQDGLKNLRQNQSTMEFVYRALDQKKTIMILAEGHTIQEKRLRPIQKGPARMAFGTVETYGDKDIHILPVGVNYTHADKFRSEVMIDFGDAIKLKDFLAEYKEKPQKGVKSLTDELEKRMQERVITIEKVADEKLVEGYFELYRNDHPKGIFPIYSVSDERVVAEKAIANRVNEMEEKEKSIHLSALNVYQEELKKLDVKDEAVVQKSGNKLLSMLTILIGLIPFILGYVFNYLPGKLAYLLGQKMKQLEFKASVMIAVGMVAYFLYYLLIFIFALQAKSIFWTVFALMLPVWGFFTLLYKEYFIKYVEYGKVAKLDKNVLSDLRSKRAMVKYV